MSILHTISRSPSSSLLESCSSLMQDGDAILFIEDGAYYCNDDAALNKLDTNTRLFTLRDDMVARGLRDRCSAKAEPISIDRFVEICCEYDKVVSWF